MDAPNAPNPANPNAQDQFLDVVQGPTNQAQGPAVQNQAQVPAGQIPAQVPAVQVPVQGPTQVAQNLPVPATTTTSSSTTSPCWYGSAHSPDNLSKLDREET